MSETIRCLLLVFCHTPYVGHTSLFSSFQIKRTGILMDWNSLLFPLFFPHFSSPSPSLSPSCLPSPHFQSWGHARQAHQVCGLVTTEIQSKIGERWSATGPSSSPRAERVYTTVYPSTYNRTFRISTGLVVTCIFSSTNPGSKLKVFSKTINN